MIRRRQLIQLPWLFIPPHTTSTRFHSVWPSLRTTFNTIADTLELGLVVAKLGMSSVTYRVGVFIQQDSNSKVEQNAQACAVIDFVHVFCDPKTRKAIPMPTVARRGLERILRHDTEGPKL